MNRLEGWRRTFEYVGAAVIDVTSYYFRAYFKGTNLVYSTPLRQSIVKFVYMDEILVSIF